MITFGEAVALSGIAVLIVIQIALFTFGYGKLNQKVSDFCNRIDKLEKKVDKIEGTVSLIRRKEGQT